MEIGYESGISSTITAIAVGNDHSMVVTSDGRLWTFGEGGCAQLGHGDRDEQPLPMIVLSMLRIYVVAVAAGSIHSLLLDAQGVLYTWGDGDFGKLGHGTDEHELTPRLVAATLHTRVVALAGGASHSMAVTVGGTLLTFGCGREGRLGQGDWDDRFEPEKVSGFDGQAVVSISAGYAHSLAVTSDGRLWSFGEGEGGKLGHGKRHTVGANDSVDTKWGHGSCAPTESAKLSVVQPMPVQFLARQGIKVVSCAAGGYHSLAVCSEGRLYSWGVGEDGQLGHGLAAPPFNLDTPKLVKRLEQLGLRVGSVGAGWAHTVVMTENGQLFTFGEGEEGQLGLGAVDDLGISELVEFFKRHDGTALLGRATPSEAQLNELLAVAGGKEVRQMILEEYGDDPGEVRVSASVPSEVKVHGVMRKKNITRPAPVMPLASVKPPGAAPQEVATPPLAPSAGTSYFALEQLVQRRGGLLKAISSNTPSPRQS
jgi:alpha-tubulin suppressor-like RCC1 family protein